MSAWQPTRGLSQLRSRTVLLRGLCARAAAGPILHYPRGVGLALCLRIFHFLQMRRTLELFFALCCVTCRPRSQQAQLAAAAQRQVAALQSRLAAERAAAREHASAIHLALAR